MFVDLLSKIRQYKAKNHKPLTTEIIIHLEKKDHELLRGAIEDFKATTKAKEIKTGKFEISF